ncbi:hypothetical protein DL767_004688 [Monosporascus sp. MG133]|nr:hypothetical protein DL767_004688 [Monosporascus sp. MG133]
MAQQQDSPATLQSPGSNEVPVIPPFKNQNTIDRRSFEYFKKAMTAQWKECRDRHNWAPGEDIRHSDIDTSEAWLHYAAEFDPKAAFEFTRIAEVARRLQGKSDSQGELTNFILPTNPLTYLEDYQLRVVDRWVQTFYTWRHNIVNKTPYADPRRYSLDWELLHSSRLEMQQRVTILNEHLASIDPNNKWYIDPSPAWRAVNEMVSRLESVDSGMSDCLITMKVPEQDGMLLDKESSLRRRRRRDDSVDTKEPGNDDHENFTDLGTATTALPVGG